MRPTRKPALPYRVGVFFRPLSTDQIDRVYQAVGRRPASVWTISESWPSLLDECTEQFIVDHYEQGNQARGAILKRLERVAAGGTRLLATLGVTGDEVESMPSDLARLLEDARPEANANGGQLISSVGAVEGGWPDLESDVWLLLALRDAADCASLQASSGLARRLNVVAAGARRLLRALGVVGNNPQSVPSDLSRALDWSRPWADQRRLAASGSGSPGYPSVLRPAVLSLVSLRDAAVRTKDKLGLNWREETDATPRAQFIELLICCFIFAYGEEPKLKEGNAVGDCWEFTTAALAAIRNNLSDVVKRTDPTIEHALFLTQPALADLAKKTIRRLRGIADTQAPLDQVPWLIALAVMVVADVRRDKVGNPHVLR